MPLCNFREMTNCLDDNYQITLRDMTDLTVEAPLFLSGGVLHARASHLRL